MKLKRFLEHLLTRLSNAVLVVHTKTCYSGSYTCVNIGKNKKSFEHYQMSCNAQIPACSNQSHDLLQIPSWVLKVKEENGLLWGNQSYWLPDILLLSFHDFMQVQFFSCKNWILILMHARVHSFCYFKFQMTSRFFLNLRLSNRPRHDEMKLKK